MENSERDLFIREIYLRTENFYKSLFYGKRSNLAVGPEIEDDFSKKYGLTYYGFLGGLKGSH